MVEKTPVYKSQKAHEQMSDLRRDTEVYKSQNERRLR